jgi:hypothetical protein
MPDDPYTYWEVLWLRTDIVPSPVEFFCSYCRERKPAGSRMGMVCTKERRTQPMILPLCSECSSRALQALRGEVDAGCYVAGSIARDDLFLDANKKWADPIYAMEGDQNACGI